MIKFYKNDRDLIDRSRLNDADAPPRTLSLARIITLVTLEHKEHTSVDARARKGGHSDEMNKAVQAAIEQNKKL